VRRALALLIMIALGGLAGCAVVKPWQREVHARRVMQPNPDPNEDRLDDHVQEYREGAIGGTGVGGGGCGCN
jgi:hypothetical protein